MSQSDIVEFMDFYVGISKTCVNTMNFNIACFVKQNS